MTFDKRAYMREYMRNRRAGKTTDKARADRMAEALTWIIKRLEGNQKPLAVELRDAAEKALKIDDVPLDTSR
jgi:hypothetical protein